MTASHQSIIDVHKLSKAFDGKQVLKGVDLVVESGTVLGLLGKNGSGKTTLIKCILGLLRTNTGSARVMGDNAWDLSAQTKARLGYVSQEVSSYPWMRVRQVIAYTRAFYPNWNDRLVAELVRRWQLPLEERTGTLSVGQLQSLGIVLALGHEPELLILDEPVASLDPAARREFLRTLLETLDKPNRTILFSTHITSDLERIANRVAILQEGVIRFLGELDELKDRVKRLRFSSKQILPRTFSIPNALRTEVHDHHASVTVADFDPALLDTFKKTWQSEIDVTDLNLEEIFVDLHAETAQ